MFLLSVCDGVVASYHCNCAFFDCVSMACWRCTASTVLLYCVLDGVVPPQLCFSSVLAGIVQPQLCFSSVFDGVLMLRLCFSTVFLECF